MFEEAEAPRDLVNLVVPQRGDLVATGGRQEPFRLVDGGGLVVAAAAEFFCDLRRRAGLTRRSGLTAWTCCGGSGSFSALVKRAAVSPLDLAG